jgi:hypothetical protein
MPVREEIACQEFVEVVTDYLEGALDRRSRRRFEAHVADCDGCEGYLGQLRAALVLTGTLRPQALAPPAREALLRLFRAWQVAAR